MTNQDIHRLAVCSDLRRNLLIVLNEGKKSLGDLRDGLQVSSTTVLHALRELEKNSLTFQDKDKNYSLTNIGRIVALKMLDFNDAAETLRNHERFWLEHDLSGIPQNLMERIGCLKDSILVENTPTDIFKVHSNFINLLKNAKEIKGVSPFFIPEFSLLFEELILKKNIDIQLLLTKEVQEKIDKEVLKKIFLKENSKFELYILKEDVKIAFTVTDYFLSIGFFRYDGIYDYNNDIISYSKEANAWGRDLFEHYAKLSQRIIL
ncbi:MAG: winged helix-turn-helix domain-containing protein [Candidatus Methanoperedens sp.]|nr:winged helix-turn-helix domain-containing protein [Candidatus Methanoperedens sp.]